jgi:hypothetical protein
MKVLILIILSLPQVATPPDLIHIAQTGCHINGRHSEPPTYVLDAKSGEQVERVRWEVIPFVEYVALPSGGRREGWEASKPIYEVVGNQDYLPREASDACSAWMRDMRKAIIDARHKAAHK